MQIAFGFLDVYILTSPEYELSRDDATTPDLFIVLNFYKIKTVK